MGIKFFDEASGFQWVRKKIKSGVGGTLAVAFWGKGAVEKLNFKQRPENSEPLEIICNLRMGGTNPSVIKELLSINNIQLYHSDRIHGKVYLFNDKVMIGSSNASANGLSFEGDEIHGWKEANLKTNCKGTIFSVKEWLATLETTPLNINSPELRRAEIAWDKNRRGRTTSGDLISVEELSKFDEDYLKDKNVYVVLYSSELSKKGKSQLDDFNKRNGTSFEAFEDWESIPKDSPLICFHVNGKKLEFEGVYQVIGDPNFSQGDLQFCQKIDDAVEMPFSLKWPSEAGERKFWSNYISQFREANQNTSDFFKKIDEFFADIRKAS